MTLKNPAELKIVNEVGSQCSPNLEQGRRGSSSRPLTPPSLDIVEEELANLGREAAKAGSLQKLFPAQDDVLDFEDDDDDDDSASFNLSLLDHFKKNLSLIGH